MQAYNSNIVGSYAYFNTKRRELETLMDREDPCTIWYTLSSARNHKVDVHELLYGKYVLPSIWDPIENVQ